jgi:predicted PurR-regulated permease PerM
LLKRADLPPSHWLKQAVFLLWILALALILAFCYFASSVCITVLLAAFLAILVDPLIIVLQRLCIPRVVSAAVVMVAGMVLIAAVTYFSYRQVSDVIDDVPFYAQRISHVISPLMQKIQLLRDSAQRISTEVPTKKVPEVKISGSSDWTAYVVRGVGPASGAAIIIGVVPFLMFFLLAQKDRIKQKFLIVWGDTIDVSSFAHSVTDMIRGFVAGNLMVGLLMGGVTMLVLLALKVDGAFILGLVSGMLNLLPFVGALLGALIPMGAALAQNQPFSALLIILLAVVALHTVCINLLIPRIIGPRVSISPVAATVGIMFWGWLWGLIGVLLAVPLTALVKIIADAHPSLDKIANLLAERPTRVPPWCPIAPPIPAVETREFVPEAARAEIKHAIANIKSTRGNQT